MIFGKNQIVTVSKKERTEIIKIGDGDYTEQIVTYYDWSELRNSPLYGFSSILFGHNLP